MTLRFPDWSHWKDNGVPSAWPALLTKATEGTTYVDPTYAGYKGKSLIAGIPFGGYHFLDPGNVTAQANHAFSVIKDTPAMLDVERSTGGNASWAEVKQFITTYRGLGGVLHLAYIPKWYWSGTWHSPDMSWLNDNDVALISSQYTTYSDDGPGWDTYGGVKPQIWQYTSTPQDMNAFKGTQDELRSVFETGSTDVARTLTDDDLAAIWAYPGVVVPANYTNAGAKISAAAAHQSEMRYILDTRDASVATNATLADPAYFKKIADAVVAALPPSQGGTAPTAEQVAAQVIVALRQHPLAPGA